MFKRLKAKKLKEKHDKERYCACLNKLFEYDVTHHLEDSYVYSHTEEYKNITESLLSSLNLNKRQSIVIDGPIVYFSIDNKLMINKCGLAKYLSVMKKANRLKGLSGTSDFARGYECQVNLLKDLLWNAVYCRDKKSIMLLNNYFFILNDYHYLIHLYY